MPDLAQKTSDRIERFDSLMDTFTQRFEDVDNLDTNEIIKAGTAMEQLAFAFNAMIKTQDTILQSEVVHEEINNKLKEVRKTGEFIDTLVGLKLMKEMRSLR